MLLSRNKIHFIPVKNLMQDFLQLTLKFCLDTTVDWIDTTVWPMKIYSFSIFRFK